MNAEIWINGENRVKSYTKQSMSKTICHINEPKMPSIYWLVGCLLLHSKWNPLNSNTHQDQKLNISSCFTSSPNMQIFELPWWLNGKESTCNAGDAGDRLDPWVRKIPWRRTWQPTNILAWKIPWTEEAGRLQSMQLQRVPMTEETEHGTVCRFLAS